MTGTSKPNSIAQFAVASQNNIIINQPKLVVATTVTTSVTTTITTPVAFTTTMVTAATKPTPRYVTNKTLPQQVINAGKLPAKPIQQFINAKLITSTQDGTNPGQKIVQPKLFMNQQNQMKLATTKNIALSKPVTLTANASTIRMVNAANLNLTQIAGKPVFLASKGTTIQNVQGQNVILQTQPNSSGNTGALVLQNTVKAIPTTSISQANNMLNQQNVVLSPQLKVQNQQQVVFSNSNVKSSNVTVSNQQNISQGHVVLESHPVRLQSTSTTNAPQRVLLASQGQGGQIVTQQILLPAGFHGTTINIKALQGVKVIPLTQAHAGRGKS